MGAHDILRDVTEWKPPRRPATYDDLLQVPDHLVAEIVDGPIDPEDAPARKA
jgi:hypothetical protein